MGTKDGDLLVKLNALHLQEEDSYAEDIPEDPGFWWKLVHLDPVLLRGAVIAGAALAGSLGFAIGDQKVEAFLAAAAALMYLVQALWTRKAVVPNAKVVAYKPDPVDAPTVIAPGPAVSTDVVQVANAAADTPTGTRPASELPFPSRMIS